MPWFFVTTSLPPAPQPSAVKVIAWLTFAYAVGFTLTHLVIA